MSHIKQSPFKTYVHVDILVHPFGGVIDLGVPECSVPFALLCTIVYIQREGEIVCSRFQPLLTVFAWLFMFQNNVPLVSIVLGRNGLFDIFQCPDK